MGGKKESLVDEIFVVIKRRVVRGYRRSKQTVDRSVRDVKEGQNKKTDAFELAKVCFQRLPKIRHGLALPLEKIQIKYGKDDRWILENVPKFHDQHELREYFQENL